MSKNKSLFVPLFLSVAIILIFSLFFWVYLKNLKHPVEKQPLAAAEGNPSAMTHVKSVAPLSWEPLTNQNGPYEIKDGALYAIDEIYDTPERKISDSASGVSVVKDSFLAKDATTFYLGGYPIRGIDMATFSIFETGTGDYFAKDANHVYYFILSSSLTSTLSNGNAVSFVVPNADPTSFLVLEGGLGYAKDKNYVYLPTQQDTVAVLKNADPATFQFISSNKHVDDTNLSASDESYYGFWGEDAIHAYYKEYLLPNSEAQSFKILRDQRGNPTGYAQDKNNVYNSYSGEIINGADPKTFIVLNDTYAKDTGHVFSYDADVYGDNVLTIGKIVDGADASSFEIISGDKIHDAKDSLGFFHEGKRVK